MSTAPSTSTNNIKEQLHRKSPEAKKNNVNERLSESKAVSQNFDKCSNFDEMTVLDALTSTGNKPNEEDVYASQPLEQ